MSQNQESISYTMNVRPEEAWDVISRVSGVDKWFGSLITSCRVDGDKRFCETAEGAQLIEDILEIDHDSRIFRYGIPQQEVLPVENIVGTMHVQDAENGKTLIEWSATFDATPENAQVAKEAFKGLWLMGLKDMESYIQQEVVGQ